MYLYGLTPTQGDGPHAEVYAHSASEAREKAHAQWPDDGWLDLTKFGCDLVGAKREFGPPAMRRYRTSADLPPA